MTVYLQKSYGGYVYSGSTDYTDLEETIGYRQRISKSLQKDGAFSAGSLHDPRRVSLTGILQPAGGATDLADMRAARDAFAAAHAAGSARPLYIDSDRYLNAEVESLTLGKWNGLAYLPFDVTFLCFDVYFYSSASSLVSLTPNGTAAVATGGTATVLPIFTLAVSSPGLITLTNGAGDACTIAPTAAGTFVLDSTQESLTLAGADSMGLFSGVFLTLAAGTDQVTITPSGGAALSSATVGFQSRFY